MVSYLATAIVAASLAAAMPQAPQWESDYGKALRATRATDDHPLLVVLESPSQSDASVQQVSYTSATVSPEEAELLAPYQLCRVDASTEYGKKVAKAFGVTSFPYTAIIDRTGTVIIYAKSGKLPADEWAETLKTYKSGERTAATLASNSATSRTVYFRSPQESYRVQSSCPTCQRRF